ncbi:MAG: Ig-like domain-containing protein [Oscillospiraceae bacterium]|nr:Ig-like domain-containing protein [Oscillospiraceae bacterium]
MVQKLCKRGLPLLLCVVLLASLLCVGAAAAGTESNVAMDVSATELTVGDTVSVTVSVKEGTTVSSMGLGIFFDTALLECTSVVGADESDPTYFYITTAAGRQKEATACSSIEEAASAGTVGFVIVGTSEAEYAESVAYTATFTAIAEGTAAFTLYEDSDGTDGCNSDAIETAEVVISAGDTTVDVTGVALDQTEAALTVGETLTLTATVEPEDATDPTVTWTSDNESVATVTGGVVTAVAIGTATITATAGDCSATCAVTVTAAQTGDNTESNVAMDVSATELTVGDTVSVTVSVKEGTTVSSMGLGIFFDTALLECTSVVGADESDPTYFYITTAAGRQKEATACSSIEEAASAGTVGFVIVGTSEAEYAESVAYTATFTAIAEGTAAFTLYEDSDGTDGYKSDAIETAEVVISAGDTTVAVTGVALDKTEAALTVGETLTLAATVEPEDATDPTVTWTSDNESVATVTDGVVTAVAAGTATITATAGDCSVTCAVTVTEQDTTVDVTGVTLDKTEAKVTEGATLTLTATVEPEDATDPTVTWTSSDESVATVTDGVVTAVAAGTATITATAGDYAATCIVTVTEDIDVVGNVSGDDVVDTEDVVLILQYIIGMKDETELNLERGDVNGDGVVDTDDAVLILQFVVGLLDENYNVIA